MSEKPLISLIIPIHNEEKNIPLLFAEIQKIIKKSETIYRYEILFINDGSIDRSWSELLKLPRDESVKLIDLSKNFGKEIALTAGIHHCQGDACITLDADLQHPIEIIPKFLEKWRQGSEIVIGVREKNADESIIKKTGSFFFYKIINTISDTPIITRATDFMLLDKKVIQAFSQLSERNRITRGLVNWLGFKKDYISFRANKRINGQPSYSFTKLLQLALNSFVSLSFVPLKLAGYLGICISFFSGVLLILIVINKYIINDPLKLNFSGTAILITTNLFLVGITLMALGLIALYIANIHTEVINRPLYITREKINFDKQRI